MSDDGDVFYDPGGEETRLGWGFERFVDANDNEESLLQLSLNDKDKENLIDLPNTQ